MCFAVFALMLVPSLIEAKCNTCSTYGVACINETAFNLCFNEKPDTANEFSCPEGTVCSQTQFKCIPKGDGPAACNPNQGCAECDGIKMFACTSRTTFAQCNGQEITTNSGKCPEGFICDSNSMEICVDECNTPEQIECDRDTPL